jgi:hypothetical protein
MHYLVLLVKQQELFVGLTHIQDGNYGQLGIAYKPVATVLEPRSLMSVCRIAASRKSCKGCNAPPACNRASATTAAHPYEMRFAIFPDIAPHHFFVVHVQRVPVYKQSLRVRNHDGFYRLQQILQRIFYIMRASIIQPKSDAWFIPRASMPSISSLKIRNSWYGLMLPRKVVIAYFESLK